MQSTVNPIIEKVLLGYSFIIEKVYIRTYGLDLYNITGTVWNGKS